MNAELGWCMSVSGAFASSESIICHAPAVEVAATASIEVRELFHEDARDLRRVDVGGTRRSKLCEKPELSIRILRCSGVA